MELTRVQIHESWKSVLKDQFESEYFSKLKDFLVEEKQKTPVYPRGSLIFNAFEQTPFDKVKVVILGQDPYHGPGQAHGLCFSVPMGVKPPPSLVNIFKEIENDLGFPPPSHGNLEYWARQGVMLLNATLTVRANQAGSHQNKGWEIFTDNVIKIISEQKQHIVFLLWGNYARAKKSLIDSSKELILEAAHPSPFSAFNGFFGCKHFSKTNDWLREHHLSEIDWKIN
jgi:uracil-DNA glycosylase